MLKQPLVRCAFRLLALAVMLGALGLLVSTEKVKAGTIEECDIQFGYCIYGDCRGLSGSAYDLCRDGCGVRYEECRFDPAYEPLPAPYPIINNTYSSCLEACYQCSSIEDFNDFNACYDPCYDYCYEHYREE